MKFLVFVILFFAFSLTAMGQEKDYVYEGPWNTTNRKLDGIQTAIVKSTGEDQWSGKFFGVWQGVKYDYTVKFTGKANALKGTAVIDGANYQWTGTIDQEKFEGRFTGDRYTGSFDMTRKK